MHRIRSRSTRSLAILALTVPFLFASLVLLPGAASAGGTSTPRPRAVFCAAQGTLGAIVVFNNCSRNSESDGHGVTLAFELHASGTDVVTWNNLATVTFSYHAVLVRKDRCFGHPTTLEVSLTGNVISNGNLPAGDPGVTGPVKATLCEAPVGSTYHVTLAHGTFKI